MRDAASEEVAAAGSTHWRVHGRRTVYDSPWVRVDLLDVEPPGAPRHDHHVVHLTADAAACLAVSGSGPTARVLVMWRHRVAPDAWGWEVPAGRLEPGEDPGRAAERETLEETGWLVRDPVHVTRYHPIGGSGDSAFHVVRATAVDRVGPGDPLEAERLEWVDRIEAMALIRAGQVPEGLSLVALLAFVSGLAEVSARDATAAAGP